MAYLGDKEYWKAPGMVGYENYSYGVVRTRSPPACRKTLMPRPGRCSRGRSECFKWEGSSSYSLLLARLHFGR